MHNNFYFLRQLTASLESKLKASVVSECFSQNKDELVIRLETADPSFFIKASLSPSFSCLSFPMDFHRARKNSVDLFGNLIGQRVESIRQFKNERSFAIRLSNDFTLLFKMHGNRSNIALFRAEKIEEIFKNNIQGDMGIKLESLDREIDFTFENFVRHQHNLQSFCFTFGKVVWRYLSEANFSGQPVELQWKAIQDVVQQLETPTYYTSEIDGKLTFSLLPVGTILKELRDPIPAINNFLVQYSQHDTFSSEKAAALSALRLKLHASENYYEKTSQKLRALQTDNNYKTWADILMANLHSIEPGSERVTLPNFYNENYPVDIRLKKDLSPQKNAEVYYTKSKKQLVEINRLHVVLADKEKEIERIKSQLTDLESITALKDLRSLAEPLNVAGKREKQAVSLPYHAFEFQGFRILVGKNAQSNDELTQRFSYKDDLWLHAKDVAGSHVLIKYQSGKNFPKDVIERAAQMAAFNSKRKTDSLCPVVVTPRKFVRKRKGDPAGTVIVEREEIIMVEPKR